MEAYETLPFRKYMRKAELDKALHTLEGIIKGIAIDDIINTKEFEELKAWYDYHKQLVDIHPFNELIPLIGEALEDNILDQEEAKDILWLCNNLKTGNQYFDIVTSDIQRLEGILHGILSDNEITQEEIKALSKWLEENEHLTTTYPYDEIYSLVVSVLSDGIIDDQEKKILKSFFSEFINLEHSKNIDLDEISKIKQEIKIQGICSISPQITIPNKAFCFTGKSTKTTRKGFAEIVTSLNGEFHNSVTQKTDYLVIGNDGNPCWAFSCYGRKVEKAVSLRKKGHGILIVHEHDFWDALDDFLSAQTF